MGTALFVFRPGLRLFPGGRQKGHEKNPSAGDGLYAAVDQAFCQAFTLSAARRLMVSSV